MPLGSPPMILETPLSTWGRLANTFSAETQTQRRTLGAPRPAEGRGEASGGSGPVSAGHLLPPPGGPAATWKERRGPCDFLVHDPLASPVRGQGGSTGPARTSNFGGSRAGAAPEGGGALVGPRPRPSPAPVDPRRAAHAPRWPLAEGAGSAGAHPGAPGPALTDLVRHPRPLVTAPRSPRPSGTARAVNQTWPRPSRGEERKAAPGVPDAEGAVRGRGSKVRSRPALRAAAADAPNPEARPRARLAPSFDHI